MAKTKDTPNLPGSSRMQMPMSSGNSMVSSKTTAQIKSSGHSTKIVSAAKGKTGIKKSNPYGDIC